MLVALYEDHHNLPGWSGKRTNPFDVFSPEKHQNLPFIGPKATKVVDGIEVFSKKHSTIPLEKAKHTFSFLTGLHNVETDNLMAHVSALCSCTLKSSGYYHYPHRTWVQISTKPNEFTTEGVPVVYDLVEKLKEEVKVIWGCDNGTYFPTEFFEQEVLREKASQDHRIWTRFFVEELELDPQIKKARNDFRAATELLKESKKEIDSIQMFGKDSLNQKINQKFNVC